MAAYERIILNPKSIASPLNTQLHKVLPKGFTFTIHHLSTPPTRTSAIYSAPPGARPERTYCERHFLAVSIQVSPATENVSAKETLVFAIEILIYSTAHSNTFFVSKADSTGYLHLLKLPKGTPSPLRVICTTFLQHLVEQRRRPGVRNVVSLFARAQDQYLFPGSIENSGKHVLDDRGLVKWWCRVLNPLVESAKVDDKDDATRGYLLVPGLDTHETSTYIPSKIKPPAQASLWSVGHPLCELAQHLGPVPPRCLVPHFPDDPKSRFLDELDDEIASGGTKSKGLWKSIGSIEQFWEMMAYRQECSAGRLVGFIWVVFEPAPEEELSQSNCADSQSTVASQVNEGWEQDELALPPMKDGLRSPTSPNTSYTGSSQIQPKGSTTKPQILSSQTSSGMHSSRKQKSKLTGHIIPRQPRIKTKTKNPMMNRLASTAYYSWSVGGRGQVVVEEVDYNRITELLLRLDFATFDLATSSSRRWITEVRSSVWSEMSNAWGEVIVGTKETPSQAVGTTAGVSTLNTGLVRKKRKVGAQTEVSITAPSEVATPVNVLGASMIRKKAKALI